MEGGCLVRPIKDKDIENLSPFSDYFGFKPYSLIKFDCPKCNNCNCDMTFVMQIYCPLDDKHNRTLYLFICMKDECLISSGCYKVVRVQKAVEVAEQPKTVEDNDWGFDLPDTSNVQVNDNDILNTNDSQYYEIESPTLQNMYFIDFYQNSYDNDFELNSDDDEELAVDNELTMYLSSDFHHNKEIILFNHGGKPISHSFSPKVENLKCKNCGSACTFEAQIFPNINNFLSKNEDWPLDFENALIYTCSKSCGEVVEEMLIVESSPFKII